MVGASTYSGDDQQVVAYHKPTRLHKAIHDSPEEEHGAYDHEYPGGDQYLQSLIRPFLR